MIHRITLAIVLLAFLLGLYRSRRIIGAQRGSIRFLNMALQDQCHAARQYRDHILWLGHALPKIEGLQRMEGE